MGPPKAASVVEAPPSRAVLLPMQASFTVKFGTGRAPSAMLRDWLSEQPLADVTSRVKVKLPGPVRLTAGTVGSVLRVPVPSRPHV